MKFLPALLLTATFCGLSSLHAKPNVVVIFIDDLGYADVGPFGATKQKTPNLDRMAQEGMKLTSFYAAPVCSVSRAQVMTGCYGVRVSVPGVYFPGGPNGLNPKEETVAERLKALGYATACVGKWHLGDQPEFLPTKQGFDHYFGIPYSNDMQVKAVGGSEVVSPILRDDKVAELMTDEQQSTLVERYTAEATKFITESKDRPFFLYFAHSAVHTPIHPGAAFRGKSSNGRFGDWVEEMDWSVGKVLATLQELKLDENTLVLFTSDNGPWLTKGADGGSALPLRGGKGSTWEGGMRVPTIARWPGKIKAGSVSPTVAGTIDIMPTVVAVAGGTVAAEPVIDGRDISPQLFGKTTEAAREAHYYFSGYKLQAVRQGPWKLALSTQPLGMGKVEEKEEMPNPRLYNLEKEIGEVTNVADKHPDIVASLRALAEKKEAEIGGNQPTSRRPAGEVANPQTLYPMESKRAGGKAKAEKEATKPAAKTGALNELKLGAVLASADAPQVTNGGFTITCTVETLQPDVVIVAHGGASAGYALHLRGGHVVFTLRHGADAEFAEIVSPDKIAGSTKLVAELAADKSLRLSVNGKEVATGKAKSFITRQPAEDFCLGHDSKVPVADYQGKAAFKGSIGELTITQQ
jgi:arylsulfatase A